MANYTEHYQLHQWEPEDSFLRTDFNEDHEKIDTALNGLAEQNAALNDLVSQCGNCRVYTTSYTGTGTYGESNPCVLTLPFKPVLMMVIGNNTSGFTTCDSPAFITMKGREGYSCYTTWSEDGKTVTWYNSSSVNAQMNYGNQLYQVAILGETE